MVTVVAWLVKPDLSVPFPLVLLMAFFSISLLSTLLHASWGSFELARKPLPTVRSAMRAPDGYPQDSVILLLDPSDLFSNGTQVALYLRDEAGFEVLVGIGFVSTIQDNGLVQVVVSRIFETFHETLSSLANSDKRVLDRIMVKPSVPLSLPPMAPLES